MSLTKYQKKVARRILEEKEEAVSIWLLLRRRLPRWSLIVLAGFGSAYLWHLLNLSFLAYGMIGFVIGGILADIGILIRGAALSPLMKSIIDYERLALMLQD